MPPSGAERYPELYRSFDGAYSSHSYIRQPHDRLTEVPNERGCRLANTRMRVLVRQVDTPMQMRSTIEVESTLYRLLCSVLRAAPVSGFAKQFQKQGSVSPSESATETLVPRIGRCDCVAHVQRRLTIAVFMDSLIGILNYTVLGKPVEAATDVPPTISAERNSELTQGRFQLDTAENRRDIATRICWYGKDAVVSMGWRRSSPSWAVIELFSSANRVELLTDSSNCAREFLARHASDLLNFLSKRQNGLLDRGANQKRFLSSSKVCQLNDGSGQLGPYSQRKFQSFSRVKSILSSLHPSSYRANVPTPRHEGAVSRSCSVIRPSLL